MTSAPHRSLGKRGCPAGRCKCELDALFLTSITSHREQVDVLMCLGPGCIQQLPDGALHLRLAHAQAQAPAQCVQLLGLQPSG